MKISIVVISIANPILIGIYKNEALFEEIQLDGKTSDVLPKAFDSLIKQYKIDELIYVNGPGSYMAIKIAYIFLKTLSQTLDTKFYAASGFTFNNSTPIKALGKKYFHITKTNDIVLDTLKEETILSNFTLPDKINYQDLSIETLPIYGLPAVS